MDKVKFLKDVEIPNLQVTGDLTVQGEAVVSNLETVVTPQNTIKLRDGATTALLSNEYTGIIAEKYDGTNTGMLVFNSTGTAYVGDQGDLQPLATRDESSNITDNSILVWDAAKQRIVDGSTKVSEYFEEKSAVNYNKIISRGEQLVVNGNALLADNTNFSQWVYDATHANNSSGSFTLPEGEMRWLMETNEYFPVNPALKYELNIDAKSKNNLGTLYSFLNFYDADKKTIVAGDHLHSKASTTKLARDLKAGDTVIYLEDVSGWSTTYAVGEFAIFWNYTNSFGYTYPKETYSKNRVKLQSTSDRKLSANAINATAKTIALSAAYTGSTIPAGTYVSQGADGATYKYIALLNTIPSTEWATYTGTIGGVDLSGTNAQDKFPPAVAYCKVGFLWNYNNAADQFWITNVSVRDISYISRATTEAKTYTNTALNDAKSYTNTTVAGYLKRGSYERIESGKNLNDYHSAGFYNVKTQGVLNCPEGIGKDAALLVYPWNSEGYELQEITETADSSKTRRWVRRCVGSNDAWTPWKAVITEENIEQYAPAQTSVQLITWEADD